jgi:hypothetical protein
MGKKSLSSLSGSLTQWVTKPVLILEALGTLAGRSGNLEVTQLYLLISEEISYVIKEQVVQKSVQRWGNI